MRGEPRLSDLWYRTQSTNAQLSFGRMMMDALYASIISSQSRHMRYHPGALAPLNSPTLLTYLHARCNLLKHPSAERGVFLYTPNCSAADDLACLSSVPVSIFRRAEAVIGLYRLYLCEDVFIVAQMMDGDCSVHKGVSFEGR